MKTILIARAWLILAGVTLLVPAATAQETRKTRISELKFESGYPTGETVRKLYDEMDFQRASQAYLWGIPAVGMNEWRKAHFDVFKARNGEMLSYLDFAEKLGILTPNYTMPYIATLIDLEKSGPFVVELPPGLMAGMIMDIWQRVYADLGVVGPDQGKGGKYLILPPGYDRFFVFSSDRATPRSLFRQSTDGSGAPERLAHGASGQNATSWSADGRWLAFTQATLPTRDDIWVLALDGGSAPRAWLQTASSEHQPAFSPDGRWIAYSSDESGRQEVMIRSFPGDGPRKQVSTAGGESPSFSSDGKTLFYRLKDQLWAVPISTDPVLAIGPSSLAFELSGVRPFTGLPNYVVTRAGDRVLAVKTLREATGAHEIQVMVNWRERLRHRVPMP